MKKLSLSSKKIKGNYIAEIKQIINNARRKAYSAINAEMVEAYWLVGRRIVEEEQNGKNRADYGKQIIATISSELTKDFGEGFSQTNIRKFRRFYLTFKKFQIQQAVLAESLKSKNILPLLSWSHYERLMRVSNKQARDWYIKEGCFSNVELSHA